VSKSKAMLATPINIMLNNLKDKAAVLFLNYPK